MLIGFILMIVTNSNYSFYNLRKFMLNLSLKIFLYILFIPILDLSLVVICFEANNPYFTGVTCDVTQNLSPFILSVTIFVLAIFICVFINLYYNDSYFLSNSFYSRMSCGYEIYMTLNIIVYAILLSQAKYIGKIVFLVYNLIVSLIFLYFFFDKYLFYNKLSNTIAGIFHVLYAWTAVFSLIFAYLSIKEEGVVYIIGCAMFVYLYLNLKRRLEDKIILDNPFHKIKNKYHLMFYLKSLVDRIHSLEFNIEAKAELIGIIQLHEKECPSSDCLTKHKNKKIYVPFLEEWSKRDKPEINDKVFLLNFILVMMNFFISQCYYSPEMLINLSLYYLQVIGNYCQAIYYYRKVKEMKLSYQENFSFIRLKFKISRALLEKNKSCEDGSANLEDINCSIYYKYEDLSQKFYDEINNDVSLSVEFWRSFKTNIVTNRPLDFNKVFSLTDKIRMTKNKVEKIWSELYAIYTGVNDLFTVYENYVEQINDDDMLRRELEAMKSKNLNSSDRLQTNYYNMLLSKETGIIIASGEKNKEGLIERTNIEIDRIFNYKAEELKGMNISILQPKIFQKSHKSFMQRYYETGEKRIVDKSIYAYGKDKDNSLIPLQFVVKIFPILNDSVYYCGLVIRQNLDDLILLDSNFIIQGISKKLLTKINLDHKHLFSDLDIPFYVICKKFINFYKNSFKKNQKDTNKKNKQHWKKSPHLNVENSNNENLIEIVGLQKSETKAADDEATNNLHEDVDIINENVELEFEIKIPAFLKDFANGMGGRDNRSEFIFSKGDTVETTEKDNENTSEYYEENENLVDDSQTSINKSSTRKENKKSNFNKESDEDKEFDIRLEKYRTYFESNKFYELEDYIEKNNLERNDMKEYKFIFTFDVYRFGQGQVGYVIRCIDNKLEYDEGSQSEASQIIGEKLKQVENQKSRVISLKTLNEVTIEEKQHLLEKQSEYPQLCVEDREFSKLQSDLKQEISNTSKVFGFKREDTQIDDENSSQSSQSGFNNDIANKSRIEEIRSNLMKNVANFHLLKWIKSIFYIIILNTAAFCAVYLLVFNVIYDDVNTISSLSIGLFQSTIWMSNIISSLISMRTMYQLDNKNSPVEFNTYVQNDDIYFENLRGMSLNWYNNISTIFAPIEEKIDIYFDYSNSTNLFWQSENVNYAFNSIITDKESFPLALAQILSNVNQLTKNPFFTLAANITNSPGYTIDAKNLITYSGFICIENAIMNLLPTQIAILQTAPSLFKQYNTGNYRYIYIILASYTASIMLFVFIYAFLLYLTNKNMEEGLEKVSKIHMDKIDDTLKKIETFDEKCLVKFRHKENTLKTFGGDSLQDSKNDNSQVNQKEKFQGFSMGKKYKSLRILTPSYLQIPLIILILICILLPIYFVSVSMINSCNQILQVQNFIFGQLLTASTSTVYIKCMMSQCQLVNNIDYTSQLFDSSQIENMVADINNFPALSDFYSNKFLLNACAVIYDSSTTQYTNCMNDSVIKSANNTDSLLKLVNETVSTIIKDQEMNSGKKYTLRNGMQELFSNPFLFETNYFYQMEYIFYNYIAPVSDSFATVVSNSLTDYLNTEKIIIIMMICIFAVTIVLFSLYIIFVFTKNLIHLLSVARCILKIIPSGVINNTPELKTWIENKY